VPAAVIDGFDFKPTLYGANITLRPLQEEDAEALYRVAADPLIWRQHPEPLRYQRQVFAQQFFQGAVSGGSAFVVLDNATGDIIGSSRFYEWDPVLAEVAIGYSFLARSHWGGVANAEMKQLMLAHAFRWARRVWFHVDWDNLRSRRALEKIGAQFSHQERKELNDVVHETAFYFLDRASTTAS